MLRGSAHFVILLVIAFSQFNNPLTGYEEQLLPVSVASSEPPLRQPSASVRQFAELAVNMPEQEPQVGQAERSTCYFDVRRLSSAP